MARASGVFPEPAAAAALAGMQSARELGHIGDDERTVVISTGSGLKDVPAVMRGVAMAAVEPIRVEADESALEEILQQTGMNP